MKSLKRVFKKFLTDKNSKGILNIIISSVLLLSAFLFSYDMLFNEEDEEKIVVDRESELVEESEDFFNNEEQELESILKEVEGVGDVSVMITYETGTESVPAVNTSVSNDQRQEDVVMSNDSQPVIIKEIKPRVKGVIIVAEGAKDIVIKSNIINATAAVFDIPHSSVSVFSKKAANNI